MNTVNLECKRGQERFAVLRVDARTQYIQYEYRAMDGELFSCVRPSLAQCRAAKDTWAIGRAS